MRVLGIDPGLRVTGYGVIETQGTDIEVIDAGILRVSPNQPLARRLLQLRQDLMDVLVDNSPDLAGVEALYSNYRHPQTAVLMGHARGVFLLCAAEHGLAVHGFAATRVKKSLTGNGRASKQQIQRAIKTQLNLADVPSPPDIADALAIALCCYHEHRQETLLT